MTNPVKSRISQVENRPQAASRRIWGVMTRLHPSRAFGALAFAVFVLAGCAAPSSQEEKEIETVDVEPGLEIDTSEDVQAKAREPALVGILPADFPSDLPLHLPASLVDFAESKAGRPVVTLLSPHEISRVRRELTSKLRAAGWESSSGTGGAMVLKKGGARAWLFIEEGKPGTLYTIEYQP